MATDLAAQAAALFASWQDPSSPGVVWAATQGGREVLSGAVGMADIAQSVPMDRRSVIRIGSQTKQFTVLLALMLEAEGKLSMQDEVHRYAPWLPKFPAPIMLQHLATNTSGMRDFLEIMTYSGLPLAGPANRAREREMIAAHGEVNFAPGTQMIYCNTGFWLLSEIIEEVSGRSFNELLAERITGPLGMADTSLVLRDTQILPRLVAMHVRMPDGGWETARWGLEIGGEVGMVSTLEDMLTWQRNLDSPKVGSAALFARMATPVTYRNGTVGLYAMGLTHEVYRGWLSIAHGGGVAGGRSESVRFPEAGIGVVSLANFDAIAPASVNRRIADLLLPGGRWSPPPARGGAAPGGRRRALPAGGWAGAIGHSPFGRRAGASDRRRAGTAGGNRPGRVRTRTRHAAHHAEPVGGWQPGDDNLRRSCAFREAGAAGGAICGHFRQLCQCRYRHHCPDRNHGRGIAPEHGYRCRTASDVAHLDRPRPLGGSAGSGFPEPFLAAELVLHPANRARGAAAHDRPHKAAGLETITGPMGRYSRLRRGI